MIEEPAIIAYGRGCVSEYAEQEYIDCLRRAFGSPGHADFIVLDSNPRGQKFVAAGAAWAITKGWLYCDRCQTGDQEQVATFRLTPLGKKEVLE